MKELQLLTSEYQHLSSVKNWEEKGIKIIFVDNWKNIDLSIPVMCYSDLLYPNVRNWLTIKNPTIYAGRGYVGNHLHKKRFFGRASVNGWANIKLNHIPYERWNIMNLPRHPWKVKEVKKVLIAPSKATSIVWTPELNHRWAEEISKKFPGAEIKIRFKPGKAGVRYETLWNDLDWADLVVSQSSAITSEAFWYGKKVISTEPCITWAAGKQLLEDWQNPREPELREAWHEHLAWSQYTVLEWDSGEAFDLIEKYLGPISQCHHDHIYNFKSL